MKKEKKIKKEKLLYDRITMSERLEDLRKGNGKNSIPLLKISKEIEDYTGVKISHTQIRTYENPDETAIPSVNNVLALAKFYGVSVEYLLGFSNSQKKSYTEQMSAKKFSLSDESMKKLNMMTQNCSFNNNEFKLQLINYIIENNWFLDELAEKLVLYFQAKSEVESKVVGAEKEERVAHYELISIFERFKDESKEKFWKPRKPNYLFEIDDLTNQKSQK